MQICKTIQDSIPRHFGEYPLLSGINIYNDVNRHMASILSRRDGNRLKIKMTIAYRCDEDISLNIIPSYRHSGDKIFWKDFERALHGLKGERQEPGVMPESIHQLPKISAKVVNKLNR